MVIDYVVPMIFNDDSEWQKNFEKVGSWYDEEDINDFVRYRSWNNERLLIQCVKRFMPWIRNIYVILAQESQKQTWMDEEGVRVVYHKDIIPERYLPTFNSQTIEMYLINIPDLSEYFIYGNDDMFPLAPLKVEDFFEEGLPCLHFEEVALPSKRNAFYNGCLSGLNFIAKRFGRHYLNTWLKGGHSLTPMLKSTWKIIWNKKDSVIEASLTPFRRDNNFNQWLCPWWHYLSGSYVDRTPKTVYVNVEKPIEEVIEAILSDNTQIICVNDNEALIDYKEYRNRVNNAIEQRLWK